MLTYAIENSKNSMTRKENKGEATQRKLATATKPQFPDMSRISIRQLVSGLAGAH
jgi:hypothetical protein